MIARHERRLIQRLRGGWARVTPITPASRRCHTVGLSGCDTGVGRSGCDVWAVRTATVKGITLTRVYGKLCRMIAPAVARRPATAVLMLAGVLAASCVLAYHSEQQELRRIVTEVVGAGEPDHQTVQTLTRWVSQIRGSKANPSYFVLPLWRATPLQILRTGGDCADRSLLLCALLEQAGYRATRVLLFDPQTSEPVHTVVEVTLAPGRYMVVDPSFDLYFPKDAQGAYFGLLDLRRDPSILKKRLAYLQARAPWPARIIFYPKPTATYELASSVNWDRDRLTLLIYAVLYPRLGEDIYRLRRPGILERPQLSCAALVGGIGLLAAMCIRAARAPALRRFVRTGSKARCDVGSAGRPSAHPESVEQVF